MGHDQALRANLTRPGCAPHHLYSTYARTRRCEHLSQALVIHAATLALASSSRSQRAMCPTTTPTPLSYLPRTVRGRPLTFAGICGGCYSFSYSLAKGRTLTVATGLRTPAAPRCCVVRRRLLRLLAPRQASNQPALTWSSSRIRSL